MSKHTPGPLRAVANEVVQEGNNIERHVATCHSPFENGDADARLFAAAPDLLEACKKMVAYIGENAIRDFAGAGNPGHLMIAAIAKADGRS